LPLTAVLVNSRNVYSPLPVLVTENCRKAPLSGLGHRNRAGIGADDYVDQFIDKRLSAVGNHRGMSNAVDLECRLRGILNFPTSIGSRCKGGRVRNTLADTSTL